MKKRRVLAKSPLQKGEAGVEQVPALGKELHQPEREAETMMARASNAAWGVTISCVLTRKVRNRETRFLEKEDMMDSIMSSLGIMMALKEIARRWSSKGQELGRTGFSTRRELEKGETKHD